MKVKELIEFLQTQDQEMNVLYTACSEQNTLDIEEIGIMELCKQRDDGWVQNKRPDKETELYLVFPGN